MGAESNQIDSVNVTRITGVVHETEVDIRIVTANA